MNAKACPESEQGMSEDLKSTEPQADEAGSAVRPSRLNAVINQIISGRIDTARCPVSGQNEVRKVNNRT